MNFFFGSNLIDIHLEWEHVGTKMQFTLHVVWEVPGLESIFLQYMLLLDGKCIEDIIEFTITLINSFCMNLVVP